MYKFHRFNLFGRISGWVLEIDSLEKYIEWHKKYQSDYIEKGIENIKTRSEIWKKQEESGKNYRLEGHWVSEVGFLSEVAGGNDEEIDLIEGFETVTNDLIEGKLLALKNEGIIYCYEGCQWFTKIDDIEAVESFERDKLIYPRSKEDINIRRWPGGKDPLMYRASFSKKAGCPPRGWLSR